MSNNFLSKCMKLNNCIETITKLRRKKTFKWLLIHHCAMILFSKSNGSSISSIQRHALVVITKIDMTKISFASIGIR